MSNITEPHSSRAAAFIKGLTSKKAAPAVDAIGATCGAQGPSVSAQPALDATRAAAALRTFEASADEVISRAHTHHAQLIVRTAAAVMVGLIVWACFANLDEVTRGDGKVISSKQLQAVQSMDGGVVSEILVREGQVVEQGQLLIKIEATRANSQVREGVAQGFALQARAARLRALAESAAFSAPPAQGDEQSNIIEEERRLFEMRRSQLHTTLAIGQQQLVQRQQDLNEILSRRSAAVRALELSEQELNRTRPLLASGAVSEVDILRLDREVSRARGDVEQSGAQMQRVQAAIGEARSKMQETEVTFRNESRRELAETMGRLNALNEGAAALTDRVEKALITSPVRGRVQRLLVHTVGGVVQAGKDLVEVVPLDDALVIEARVTPRDIAFIHAGQSATVKITAYDFSIYGGLQATVVNISPDTITDEKGNAFYMVRVQTEKASLGSTQKAMPIQPGMTAEIDILTGNKSVMSYLLKPVLRAKGQALRER